MLSSVLDRKKTLFSSLSNIDPFPLPPMIFGCMSFMHDYRPNGTKYLKGINCIFFGYSRTHNVINNI